ncbi:MAG: hypothetical protein IJZ62_02505 [Clostridia bacterium]|nr:hypothetical protein [Clostridia bacterium]
MKITELEKEMPTFIGFRKEAQISNELTKRTMKELRGREGLQERSARNRTTTQRRHEINKARKTQLQNLMKETKLEQEEVLLEEFERNL